MKSRKGLALSAAPAAVLMLVFIGLLVVVGIKINNALLTDEYEGNTTVMNWSRPAYYAAQNTTAGLNQIVSQLSLVGLIVVMAIVIGVLWTSFGGLSFGNAGGI